MMGSIIYTCKLASRGWHFYGRNIWAYAKEGEILFAEKEKSKLVADTVGHVSREISRAVVFFYNVAEK